MAYVDGFVLPMPEDRIGEYRKIARRAGKAWMAHCSTWNVWPTTCSRARLPRSRRR